MTRTKSINTCKRIQLAGGESCKVLFCESCNVAELELGAMSLRLEPAALQGLAEVLQQARAALALLAAVEPQRIAHQGAGHVH